MRVEQLTFTRFIAAIGIVVFHFGMLISPFRNPIISFLFEQAHIGVSYFFVLSGFVMILAYGDKEKIHKYDYWVSRFARIYPVYIFALVMLFVYFLFQRQDADYDGFILNVLLLQSWIPNKALSFKIPGWSVSVEMFFYLIFPYVFNIIIKKISLIKMFYIFISVWIVTQVIFLLGFHSEYRDFCFYNPLMHLNEFLIGLLAGIYYRNNQNLFVKCNNRIMLFVVVLILLVVRLNLGLLLYYTALLVYHGHSAQTHSGVIRLFGLNYVTKGLVSKETARFYSKLFEIRQTGDYDDLYNLTEEEVKPLIELAQKYIDNLESLINS